LITMYIFKKEILNRFVHKEKVDMKERESKQYTYKLSHRTIVT